MRDSVVQLKHGIERDSKGPSQDLSAIPGSRVEEF